MAFCQDRLFPELPARQLKELVITDSILPTDAVMAAEKHSRYFH